MRKLTDFEKSIIEDKGTERPFSGEYHQHDAAGIYCCKKCDAPLYRSESKFNAYCGWPAFDDEIKGAVKREIDADGSRTEILCANCHGHLGHVFEGERLTDKNIRHCVNSISLVFKDEVDYNNEADEPRQGVAEPTAVATLGGGCFWCLEAIFSRLKGVIDVTSGYAGGQEHDANYKAVCSGETGHAEVVQILFDPNIISYKALLTVFWQSHDPTTQDRQGADKGPQYRSVIFIHDELQADVANQMLTKMAKVNIWDAPVVTQVVSFTNFFPAEAHHKDYFLRNSEQAYCQSVVRPKVEKIEAMFKDKLKSYPA